MNLNYLVLKRTFGVYLDHDRYMNVGANIYLPVDHSKHVQMYGQELTKHSSVSTQTILELSYQIHIEQEYNITYSRFFEVVFKTTTSFL